MEMISEDLARHGYAIVPNFISQKDLFSIVEEVNSLQTSSLFQSAGVGRALDYQKGDGGELVLYTPDPLRVEPIGGTLVCFLSRDIEHEVLESSARRLSFASWFRKRPVTLKV